jgi:O-antigen ligase
MRARAAGVVAALGFLTLVSNRFPVLPASCLALATLIILGSPGPLGWRLAGVWAFWVASFLMTGESLRLLVSPEFHRRDGQIFFSTLPLLTFAWIRPDSRQCRGVLAAFWIAQALVAAVSCGFDLAGHRLALQGYSFYPDEGLETNNYCGFYQAHNAVGSVQALGVLVAATLSVFSVGPRARWFWGLLTIPLVWGVILSRSRGSLLAMSVCLLFLGGLALKRRSITRRALLGMGLVLGVTFALFGSGLTHRLGQFGDESGTHTARWEWWKRAVVEWTWSPVIGEGMGRYNDLDREWTGIKHVCYIVTKGTVVNSAFHAHNSYVHFLAEGGILGLGLTVGFWAWVAWKLRRSREPLRIAAFLGVLYLFAISPTEHYMGGGAMLLVLSSLVGAAWNLPEPTATTTPAGPAPASPPRSGANGSGPGSAVPPPQAPRV